MKKQFLFFALGSLLVVSLSAQVSDLYAYREINNLSYLPSQGVETDSLQHLNLVVPEVVEKPPLLIWIGGGAWSFVNRHMEMDLARQFARQGIAVASVGHRLSKGSFSPKKKEEGVQHPAHVEDVAAAFKWLHEQAGKYGYDPDYMFVGGFSSGAHLATLLASDDRYLARHGLDLDRIKGILPVAGTYDIEAYYAVFQNHEEAGVRAMAVTHVEDVFGDPDGFEAASPATYLGNLKAPMLLISEGALFEYTQHFEELIWASEYRDCQILHLLNFDHGGLWRNISKGEASLARDAMIGFIRQQTRSQVGG